MGSGDPRDHLNLRGSLKAVRTSLQRQGSLKDVRNHSSDEDYLKL